MKLLDELLIILENASLIEEGFIKEIPNITYTIPQGTLISTDNGKTSRPVKSGGEEFTESFSVFNTEHFDNRTTTRNISIDSLIAKLAANNNELLTLIVNDILTGENLGDGKAIVLDNTDPLGWVAYIFSIKIKEIENAKSGEFKYKNNSLRLITTVDKNSTKYSNKNLYYPTNTSGNARMYIFDKGNKFNVMNSNRYRKNNFVGFNK